MAAGRYEAAKVYSNVIPFKTTGYIQNKPSEKDISGGFLVSAGGIK